MLRKTLFWIHLSIGLAVGLIIAWLALTGLVLSFEGPALSWAESKASHLDSVPAGAQRLSLDALAAKVAQARAGAAVTGFSIQNDPQAAVRLQLGRDKAVFLDPYSGAITGDSASGVADFFHFVEDMHRFSVLEGRARDAARQFKYACNALFFVMILSGLYLWWPRNKSKAVWWPKGGLKGKARDFNWHQALGLLFWPFIVTISFTGLILSYSWASDLLYRASGEVPPARQEGPAPQKEKPREREGATVAPNFEALYQAAVAQSPQWLSISSRPSRPGQDGASLNIVYADARIPQGRGTLSLDAKGAVKKWEPFEGLDKGRQMQQYARWSHTGEAFGPIGRALAALACCSILGLFLTGWSLAAHRFSLK